MDMEATLQPSDVKESQISLPFPSDRWGRVLYALFVTVLPVTSFFGVEFLKPEWQTGKLSDYVILFLFPEASLFFFLLLAYSIISYLLLLVAPTRFAESFAVRLGIYTGVLLALQYTILVFLYSLDSFAYAVILTWIFPFIYSMIYRWAAARWTAPKVNQFLLIAIVASLVLGGLITNGSVPFLALIALIMAAPFWSFLLAFRTVLWLLKYHETRPGFARGLGLTAWLGAYTAALRFDILKMYELYAALPPTPPPDCYIATAAARGHPRFVGAWTVQRADGISLQVNTQLQHLKCAELALLAVNPHLHSWLRRVYDKAGKSLAQYIQHPLLADLAYLLLKPWEWLATFTLKRIVPEIDSISKNIYNHAG